MAARWAEFCSRYLPVAQAGSVWRYSRGPQAGEPEQGWKLHVSATVLNAHRVLERIAPVLCGLGVTFKAPASLEEVRLLNSGIHYPYSQVGKVFTVYPRTDEEAVRVARRLHELTRRMSAPAVPFDLRFRPGSNVYYRYGAFKPLEMELPGGGRAAAIRDALGELVPDVYAYEKAKPEWAADPFAARRRAARVLDSPLRTTFRVFGALSQRGKGGVYQAVDISARPPRLCLLKEGRRAGEVGWDGRDGRRMVRHEERVLTVLREQGVGVPRVHSRFELGGSYYLVIEFIDGESLHSYLRKRRRRMPVSRVLRYGIQLSDFIARLHDAGWAWWDCKPTNIMVTKRGELRPLDFEGACPLGRPDPRPWMTPAFTPPDEGVRGDVLSGAHVDLYALGAVIYLLLTGRMPESSPAVPPAKTLRHNAPLEVCDLLSELLAPGARPCPDARAVTRRLSAALHRLDPQAGPRRTRRTPSFKTPAAAAV